MRENQFEDLLKKKEFDFINLQKYKIILNIHNWSKID